MKRTYGLFLLFVFCTLCNGQVKNLPKENATISTGQPKLIKTQASGPGNNVYSSLQDKKGNLWFTTTGEGVYRYDGKTFTSFTTKDGLNSNNTFSILEDKNGNIWIGTDTGLSLYDEKTFTYIPLSFTSGTHSYPSTTPNDKPSAINGVTSSVEDKMGTLWFGTDNGVYCYDGKAFKRFLDNPSVVNNKALTLRLVNRMLEDRHGNIWFATKLEGICRYDGNSIVNFKPDNQEWFRGLLEDRDGNIWAGTRYRGVYRYATLLPWQEKTLPAGQPGFTRMMQNGNFDSYTVTSIIHDKSGNIWFGTEAGEESKRETEGGVWVYDGSTFNNVSKKDDLSHDGVSNLLEDMSGNIWIGTRNTGLYRFDGKTFTRFSE